MLNKNQNNTFSNKTIRKYGISKTPIFINGFKKYIIGIQSSQSITLHLLIKLLDCIKLLNSFFRRPCCCQDVVCYPAIITTQFSYIVFIDVFRCVASLMSFGTFFLERCYARLLPIRIIISMNSARTTKT